MSFFSQDVLPPPPDVTNFWQYLLLVLLTGGGVAAFRQFAEAYKSLQATRDSSQKTRRDSEESAVRSLVGLLQGQLDDVREDYETRLKSKDEYYQGVLATRERLFNETLSLVTQQKTDLQSEVSQLQAEIVRLRSCS